MATEQASLDPTEFILLDGDKKISAANLRQDFIRNYSINHTLGLGDAGSTIHCKKGTAQQITLPHYGTTPFRVGTTVGVLWLGAGAVTIKAATGVTLNAVSGGSGALTAQFSLVLCVKIGQNTWVATGAIGTVS